MIPEQKRQSNLAQALGMDRTQVAALLITGFRLYQQGRLRDAQRIFEGLVVLDARNAYVQAILGSLYQKQGQYELALIRYNNALALFPEDLNCLTNRGEILLQLGRFQPAAEDFNKAIELDPGKNNAAANRARLLISLVQDAIGLAHGKGIAGPQPGSQQM